MSLRPAHTSPPRLRAVTRDVAAIEDVLAYTPSYDPLFWSRGSAAIAGFGSVLTWGRDGESLSALARTWRAIAAAAEVDDPVGVPGTGLIAFGAFVFDERSERRNVLVVPDTIVGRRGTRTWVTRIGYVDAQGLSPELPPRTAFGPHWSGTLGPGAMTADKYTTAVGAAVEMIRARELDKVVLARDLVGTVPCEERLPQFLGVLILRQ